MIFYEIAILGGFFILAIVAIAAFGRPMAEAYAEKVKLESRDPGASKAALFEKRIKELESQVESLSQQMTGLSETVEFTVDLLDKKESQRLNKPR